MSSAKSLKLKEQAVQDWLTGQYDTKDRYRPNHNRGRYGLRVQLLVRLNDNTEDWVTRTRWFKTPGQLAETVRRLKAGLGLYGQQARTGRLRGAAIVGR